MSGVEQWGIGVVIAFQRFSPALDAAMTFLSFLGREEFYIGAVAFLYWCVNPSWGLRALAILLISDFVNNAVKWAFHAPRPYWVAPQVQALSAETGYGIPSGHAQTGLAFWGFHAATLRSAWGWAAALLLVLGISLSRVYLGVHFPHDVIAGWILGAAVLVAFLWIQPRAAAWMRPRSPGVQVAMALWVAVALLGITLVARGVIAGFADPPTWEAQAAAAAPPGPGVRAIDPRTMNAPLATIGVVFGAGAGAALARRSARFDARGPWRRRLARLALGLVVLLALRIGLAVVLPREPEVVGWVARAVRYAALGLWAVWLAPWVFLRLRLADPAPAPEA